MKEELKIYEIQEDALNKLQYATISVKSAKTNQQIGTMTFKLFPTDAPQNVTNFATLAQNNFYNGLIFHRVIPGFVAQGGCPYGTGVGGPGYRVKCEVADNKNKHKRGSLSMAHAGRDTGGSQFFICFAPQPHLDGEHTVFGAISVKDRHSFEVLDSIKEGDMIESVSIYENLPEQEA